MNIKLCILAPLVLCLPAGAFAMTEMQDADMSVVTAQDGMTIRLNTSGISLYQIRLHDLDGFAGAGFAGALVWDGPSLVTSSATPFVFEIDAGANAITVGNQTLQIKATLPAMQINTGTLYVRNSQRDNGGSWDYDPAGPGPLVPNMQINLGQTNFTMQLGSEFQTGGQAGTDLMFLNLNSASVIDIYNAKIDDVGSGGQAGVGHIILGNASSAGFQAAFDVNLTPAGLTAALSYNDPSGMNVYLEDTYVGFAYVGDIGLMGIKPAADTVFTFVGH